MKKWQKLLAIWLVALLLAALAPIVGFVIGEVIRGVSDPLGHVLAGMAGSGIAIAGAWVWTLLIVCK